jgi:hypothetical protein
MQNSFKSRLKSLPISGKLVLLGSLGAVIGVFLPWYSDIDRFKIGDTFLGVTGPLYLAGLMVFLASAISFGLIISKLLDKKLPTMKIKEWGLHTITGSLSLLMLTLSASVFFHSKFGLNLTEKSAGIGLTFCFIGSGVSVLGALLMRKQKTVQVEEQLEPLIDLSNSDRERGDVELETESEHEPVQEEMQRESQDIDRHQTIEEAMHSSRVEVPDPPTQAWSQIQESIHGIKRSRHDDTKDIL